MLVWLRLTVLLVLLAGLATVALAVGVTDTDEIQHIITQAGPWPAAAFFGVYVLGVVAAVPAAVMSLTAGLLFGWATGTVLAVLAGTTGAYIAYQLAQSLGRDGIQRLLGPRFAQVDQWVTSHALPTVFALRIIPFVPSNVANYVLGVTGVPGLQYLAGTFFGIIPGRLAYAVAADHAAEPLSTPFLLAVGALGLGVLVGAAWSRRHLRRP